MIEPTRALDTLLEEVAPPLHRQLATIVRWLLGASATDEDVRMAALSIMGQCVYYHHARTVLTRLYPEQMYGAADIAAPGGTYQQIFSCWLARICTQ